MEIVVRVALLYFFVLVGLRLLGKREFGQLSPLETITILLIPEIVSPALIREDSIVKSLVGIATILSIVLVISVMKHLSKRVTRVIEGKPSILVHDGHLNTDVMNKERLDPDEILVAMRNSGIEKFSDIQWALLEVDGVITIIPRTGIETTSGNKKDLAA